MCGNMSKSLWSQTAVNHQCIDVLFNFLLNSIWCEPIQYFDTWNPRTPSQTSNSDMARRRERIDSGDGSSEEEVTCLVWSNGVIYIRFCFGHGEKHLYIICVYILYIYMHVYTHWPNIWPEQWRSTKWFPLQDGVQYKDCHMCFGSQNSWTRVLSLDRTPIFGLTGHGLYLICEK